MRYVLCAFSSDLHPRKSQLNRCATFAAPNDSKSPIYQLTGNFKIQHDYQRTERKHRYQGRAKQQMGPNPQPSQALTTEALSRYEAAAQLFLVG
jgi:hypothetical protein